MFKLLEESNMILGSGDDRRESNTEIISHSKVIQVNCHSLRDVKVLYPGQ